MKFKIAIILISCPFFCNGQEIQTQQKGVFFSIDIEHIVHSYSYLNYSYSNFVFTQENKQVTSFERNFRFYIGYYSIPNKLSVSFVSGLNVTNGLKAITIPLAINTKYYITKFENSPYLSLTFGQLIGLKQFGGSTYIDLNNSALYTIDPINRGSMLNVGIGFKYKFFRYLSADIRIGYDTKFYSYNKSAYLFSNRTLHTRGPSFSLTLFVF